MLSLPFNLAYSKKFAFPQSWNEGSGVFFWQYISLLFFYFKRENNDGNIHYNVFRNANRNKMIQKDEPNGT